MQVALDAEQAVFEFLSAPKEVALPAAAPDAFANGEIAEYHAKPIVVVVRIVRTDMHEIVVANSIADRSGANLAIDRRDTNHAVHMHKMNNMLDGAFIKRRHFSG